MGTAKEHEGTHYHTLFLNGLAGLKINEKLSNIIRKFEHRF
jgi:hypothetical protein